MPLYKYKVINLEGKKIEGTFNANSKNEVQAMIKDNNYYPITIEEQKAQVKFEIGEYFSKVSIKDLAVMCRQFYTMIDAGSTMLNALDILKDQISNKKLKKAVFEVYEDVQKGNTLSQSMAKQKKVFPELFTNMVQAGEASGNLDVILNRMAEHYEKENKINSKVKSAMVYPMMLGLLSVGVVIFLLTFIMPTFISMFNGAELPGPTLMLLKMSNFLTSKWYIAVTAIILMVVAFNVLYATEKGSIFVERMKLEIPIVKGTSEKIIVARFTRSLSTILYSGVSLVSALEVVSGVLGNKLVQQEVMRAKDKIMKGIPLSNTISDIKIFPKMLYSMIKIGEESGRLDEILDKTANFYDNEVEEAIQKLTAMIEPVMLILMGGIVGFIVIAMMLPMFDMVSQVQ